MEQKDYRLREIEKIGTIVRAVWENLFGGKNNSAITIEHQIDAAKEQLFLRQINTNSIDDRTSQRFKMKFQFLCADFRKA